MKNNYELVVGYSDALTNVMLDSIESGTVSESRAYEIKKQLKEEYESGRVKDENILYRAMYLQKISEKNELEDFKEFITRVSRFCPYCSKAMINDDEDCSYCGYHSTVEEQTRLETPEETYEELEDDLLEMMEEMEDKINLPDYHHPYSFDSEKIFSKPEIDLYAITSRMVNNLTFDESYDLAITYSELSKDELYELALKKNYIKNKTALTEKGLKFTADNLWMEYFQNFLENFNFDEFEEFYKNSNSSVECCSLDFLDKHIDDSKKKRDFNRLITSYSSKAAIYDHIGRYENSLKTDLKIFILNLNPLYLTKQDLKYHEPVDEFNIYSLREFTKHYTIKTIQKLFNQQWSEIDFEKMVITKKQSWKLLKKLLIGYDVEKACDNLQSQYG